MSKHSIRGRVAAVVVACFLMCCVALTTARAATVSTYGEKPANGTTQGQPFAAGTGGSRDFRIPGIVTLDNGTIVAATDARWNTYADGGGLDTIVSVSTDGGATWTYTFANYLGDNGNAWNAQSTAFIDPAIATDGTTIYLVADIFPAGIALNGASSSPATGSTGFTDDGTGLLLRANGGEALNGSYAATVAAAEYGYYLDLETLTIHNASDGSPVEGYTVDAFFNITETATGTTKNLFCADAPFQVYPTDYLYLTTSTDGLTWSAPTLINAKEPEEQVLLVGPGNGLVLGDGTVVFSVYEFTAGKSGSGQAAGIIWSTDGGRTWDRSASVMDCATHWTSEATVVQINDTTVRQFYRDGYSTLFYSDYTKQADGTWVPGAAVNTGMAKRYNNQLSAIRYSAQIDGRDAIIVSTAANPDARQGGRLYVGLINDDLTMDWKYAYAVNGMDDYYAYSCLTELADGSIGLLYESGATEETFVVIPMSDITSEKNDLSYTQESVTMMEDGSATVVNPFGDYSGTTDTSGMDASVATVALEPLAATGSSGKVGSAQGQYGGATVDLSDCLFTFAGNDADGYVVSGTDASGETVYLDPSEGAAGYPVKSAQTNKMTVTATDRGDDTVYLRSTGGTNRQAYLFFYRDSLRFDRVNNLQNREDWIQSCSVLLYRPVASGETSSAEIPGYVKVTDFSSLDGNACLIVFLANNGSYYVLYPSASMASKSHQAAQVVPGGPSTKITFTAVAPGSTGLLVGSTYYSVTVSAYERVSVELALAAGSGDATYFVAGTPDVGAYDEGVATVTVTPTIGASNQGDVFELSAAEYVFTRGDDGSFTASAQTADGATVYLSPTGQGAGFPYSTSPTSFTISEGNVEGSFYLYDGSRYLYFANGAFDRVMNLDQTRCSFYLYVKDEATARSAVAGYRQVTSADEVTSGSYLVVPASAGADVTYLLFPSASSSSKSAHVASLTNDATLITISPVAAGTTSVKIGDVFYDITVEAATYTVSFGVEGVEDLVVTDGEKVVRPADPTRAGYAFCAWMRGGATYDFDAPVTSDLSLTPSWELNAPTVELAASKDAPTVGETVTLAATAGHEADGVAYAYAWTKDGAAVAGASGSSLEVTESGTYAVTVTATDADGLSASATTSVKVAFAAAPSDDEPGGTTEKPGGTTEKPGGGLAATGEPLSMCVGLAVAGAAALLAAAKARRMK